MPRRFQFSLRDLLWLVFVVAGFLGGMAIQKHLDEPVRQPYSIGFDGKGNVTFRRDDVSRRHDLETLVDRTGVSIMPRPQFTIRTLLVAMLVVAAYFGGIAFERERRRREEEETRRPKTIMEFLAQPRPK